MLNIFGKNKGKSFDQNSPQSNSNYNPSPFSIFLNTNGEVQFIDLMLRDYLFNQNILDVTKILPKNLEKICSEIAKSKKVREFKCECNDKTWEWSIERRSDKSVAAQLTNHGELVSTTKKKTQEILEADQINEQVFAHIPASLCVTSADTFEVIFANTQFEKMFNVSLEEKDSFNISSVIKNDAIIQDIKSSVIDTVQIDNVVFSYGREGSSFWQSDKLFISTNIKKSQQPHGEVLVWIFEDFSDYKKLQQQHELYKQKFNTSIQAATEGIWEWSKLNENGDWWSKPMYTLLGLDEAATKPSLERIKRLMHPADKKKYDYLFETEMRSKQFFEFECRMTVSEKGFRWFRIRVVGAYDSNGDLIKLIGSLVNIHAGKTNRIQLQQEKDKAFATLNSIVDAVITTNHDGIIEYGNSAAERLTGVPVKELRGSLINSVVSFYKEHSMAEIDNPMLQCLTTGERMTQKIYADMLDRDGTRYTVQVMATPLVRKEGAVYGAVLVLNDVTNIRILSRRLKYQASHDILTKLINRSEFEKRVQNAIIVAQEESIVSSVLYIDLDRFKLINDICGHIAGDELLKQVAKLIRNIADRDMSVARMGGDEFAVLIESCNIDAAEIVAKKILSSLEAYRFTWNEKTFSVEASIGLAEIRDTCDGLTYILNAVDSACYLAKESGRNCIRKYSEGDDTVIERKGQERWIQHFDTALQNDDLVLYGQTMKALQPDNPKKMSIEVLVRMLDSDGNIIPPNAFLPAVERFDRAYKLDKWIIEKVFTFLDGNKDFVERIGKCSINLSGQSMAEDDLLRFIQQKAKQYNIDSGKVCFEITETAAIANLTTAIDLINNLRDDGFLFALDDFGSGLSSFAYLKSLPVDFLKIDGIFVKDIHTDKINYAMVKAIQDMSVVLNKQTIAEYVDNEHVVELLTEMGIDYGQGFYLGKPQPLEDFVNADNLAKVSAA